MNYDEMLAKTLAADDIDMLINICMQTFDNGLEDEPSTQIPDPTIHCKYWEEIGLSDLCEALERKYANAKRLHIPAKFNTSF